MKHLIIKSICALTLIISSVNILAQFNYWSDTSRSDEPAIKPLEYRVLNLEVETLKEVLLSAPYESSVNAIDSPSVIVLPLPDG